VAKSTEALVSFSAGEWSPTLTARVDQQKYRAACIQLRNMLALKTGPATRRLGLQMIAPTKYIGAGDYCARSQEFIFSTNTKFVMEWGHNYVRFYSNGAQVQVPNPTPTTFAPPVWNSGSTYALGDFVNYSGVSYRCLVGLPNSIVTPDLDTAHWSTNSPLELETPYGALVGAGGLAATDVFQLQFCDINDVIYISHPNYPRASLTRYSDTDWVYAVVQDLTPPLLDENATDTTIAASSASGSTNLTATAPAWVTDTYYDVGDSVLEGGNIYECNVPHTSNIFAVDLADGDWTETPIFLSGHVGAYWELSYLRDSAYVEYDGTAASGFSAGTSSTITAFGTWEVHTYGVWSADIEIQSSDDGGNTWQSVSTVTGRNDRNVDIAGTADQPQLYQIVVTNVAVPITPGPTNPRIVFECVDAFLYGIVQITAVTDAYHAVATVITPLTVADEWISGNGYLGGDRVGYNGVNYICINDTSGSTPPPSDPTDWLADGWPTVYWSEGAWSAVRGYPACTTAFQQRVWCGFTAFEPQRIWGTQTDDIQNWDLGDQTLATDGMAFDLDAVGDGAILWMQSQDALFLGLSTAEWVVSAGDGSQAITPQNINAQRQSKWGSNPNVPAKVVGDALVFAQRQAVSLRQMLYSVVTNKYMSQDLTALSDEVLNGGAIQLAYQEQGQKNGFVWATTLNGEMVGMTYELDQEIFGWHRHYTGLNSPLVTQPWMSGASYTVGQFATSLLNQNVYECINNISGSTVDPANDTNNWEPGQNTVTDAGFESVCSIPGTGTNDDEVWCVVNRTINGVSTRFMERMNPINWQSIIPQPGQTPGYGPDKDQAYYVDCGLTFVSPTSNVFPGFAYLTGRTVAVCINAQDYGLFPVSQQAGTFVTGNVYQILTIGTTDFTAIGAVSNTVGLLFVATGPGTGTGTAGGDIVVPNFTPNSEVEQVAQIGLPFTSTVQPMNLDVDVHTGVTQGLIKKVCRLTLSLLNTLACTVTDGSARKHEVVFRKTSDPLAETPLFTGNKRITDFPGDYGLTIPVIISTSGPLPLTVRGVAVDYDIASTP
jgi:hypothetical protein